MKRTHLNWAAILLAGASFTACSSSSKGDGTITTVEQGGQTVTVCDFAQVKDTLSVPLSEWVEDCRLIHFENLDTALFKIWQPTISDNYIGIRQHDRRAFKLFNHDGKFLCDVGQPGHGPGEYGFLYGEAIDEKNKAIYIAHFAGRDYISQYNMDGTFNKNIPVGVRLNKPKVILNDDGSLDIVHMPMGKDQLLAAHITKGGEVKKYIPNEDNQILFRDFENEIWLYKNVPGLTFAYTSVDTLFHYNPEANCLEARFTMTNKPEKTYTIYDELPGHFRATVWGRGVIVVDKKAETSSYIKLVNDFFGGLPAPTNFIDGWFYAMYEPSNLMELIEERLGKSDCTEKDKEVLNKLLDSLDENANNVMMIGKLKQ